MGFFWQGLPPFVIEWASELLPGTIAAVETGTFQGDTSLLLAESFGSCTTMERSPTLAAAADRRFRGRPNITVLEGSSRDLLGASLPDPSLSCFFWLDAHGVYDYRGEDPEENPLLQELDIILKARGHAPNVIAVDDARGMGTQPGWPALAEVLRKLDGHGYVSAVVDDTLVSAPGSLSPDFYALYLRSRTVEVSAVFHIWPGVMRASRTRAWSDRVVVKTRKLLGR